MRNPVFTLLFAAAVLYGLSWCIRLLSEPGQPQISATRSAEAVLAVSTRLERLIDGVDSGRSEEGLAAADRGDPAAVSCSISVRHQDGAPVAGAAVKISQEDGEDTLVGQTEEGGLLEAELPPAGPFIVSAMAEGLSVASIDVTSSTPSTIELILGSEGHIRGRMEWATPFEGDSFESGAVIALSLGQRWSPSRMRAVVEGRPVPGSSVALVDDDGGFSVDGLLEGQGYVLLGACGSGITLRRTRATSVGGAATPGDEGVTLKLHSVYAAVIRPRSSDGGLLRVHPQMNANRSSWDILVTRADLSPHDGGGDIEALCFSESFVGILGHATSRDERLAVVTGERPGVEAAPLALKIDLPGYEPTTVSLDAAPFGVEELPVYEPRLEALFEGLGSIRVRAFGDCTDLLGPFDGSTAVGKLHLRPTDDPETLFSVPVMRPVDEYGLVTGIPEGTYAVGFASSTWPIQANPAQITVSAEESTYELVIPPRGALTASIHLPTGEVYEGSAILRVRRVDVTPVELRYINFDAAPYNICYLSEGHYEVAVHYAGARGMKFQPVELEVQSCEIAIADLMPE